MGGSLSPWLRSYKRQSSVHWEASILVVLEDLEKSAEMEEKTVQDAQKILGYNPLAEGLSDKLAQVKLTAPQHVSIYRVPSKLRKVKDDAYNPRVVSIGPLRRNDPNLLAMEEHKWRYMLLIFQQTDDLHNTAQCLKYCTDVFYGLGSYPLNKEVRESYAVDLDLKDIDRDLAEMMLLDGCFILQLFLRYHQICLDNEANDPIFSSAWMLPTLRHDLTLLENQIPFFILEELYRIIRPYMVKYTPPDSVASLALKFFQPMHQQTIKEGTDTEDCKHLLHLLHNFFRPSLGHIIELGGPATPSNQQTKKEVRPRYKKDKFQYCASKLYDAGVLFKPGSTDGKLVSIEFDDGVIKIPPLFVDETTDSLFRNLIAFEQCHFRSSQHITSYVIVMKSLIRSEEDIKLLKKIGIVIAEGKYYVDFQCIMKDFYFDDLCDEVNAYTRSYWFRRYIKDRYRTYFSSAWSATVFTASILAFILTSFQTYFTIFPR